jgi:predicted DNA-binding transcriptional regulator YafY
MDSDDVKNKKIREWSSRPALDVPTAALGDSGVAKRLRYALEEGQRLEITYAAPDELSRRVIRPKSLFRRQTHGVPCIYIRAYCELDQDDRTFRFDRIKVASVPEGPADLRVEAEREPPKSAPKPPRTNKTRSSGRSMQSAHRTTSSSGCLLYLLVAVAVLMLVGAAAASLS